MPGKPEQAKIEISVLADAIIDGPGPMNHTQKNIKSSESKGKVTAKFKPYKETCEPPKVVMKLQKVPMKTFLGTSSVNVDLVFKKIKLKMLLGLLKKSKFYAVVKSGEKSIGVDIRMDMLLWAQLDGLKAKKTKHHLVYSDVFLRHPTTGQKGSFTKVKYVKLQGNYPQSGKVLGHSYKFKVKYCVQVQFWLVDNALIDKKSWAMTKNKQVDLKDPKLK